MGRKHKHPEHENLERWLVSYADFITLLFATFTALYAITNADLAKFKNVKEVLEAVKSGFKEQSLIEGVKAIFEGKTAPAEQANVILDERGIGDGVVGDFKQTVTQEGKVEGATGAGENSEPAIEVVESIQEAIKGIEADVEEEGDQQSGGEGGKNESDLPPGQGVTVAVEERGIKISFDSRLLFSSGSAGLKPGALKALSTIADRLNPEASKRLLHVEGHTDNIPLNTAVFPSNWELSTARASAVVRFLVQKKGFPPANIAAVGYADTRPVSTNATATGREKNRRIDIILLNDALSKTIDPTLSQKKAPEVDKKLLQVKGGPPTSKGPHDGTKAVAVRVKEDPAKPSAPKDKKEIESRSSVPYVPIKFVEKGLVDIHPPDKKPH